MVKVEFTILFSIELKSPCNEKGFIFTHSDKNISIAAYVQDGSLHYGVIENNPLNPKIKDNELQDGVSIPISEYYNTPVVLTFDYSLIDGKCLVSAAVDQSKKQAEVTPAADNECTSIFFSLGASPNNNCFGKFKLFQTVSYLKILNEQEQSQLLNYFKEQELSAYVDFDGSSFMFKDISSNHLIQPNDKYRPTHIKLSDENN